MAKSKRTTVKVVEMFTEQMGRSVYNFPDNCFNSHGIRTSKPTTPEGTVNLKKAIRTVQKKHMA